MPSWDVPQLWLFCIVVVAVIAVVQSEGRTAYWPKQAEMLLCCVVLCCVVVVRPPGDPPV